MAIQSSQQHPHCQLHLDLIVYWRFSYIDYLCQVSQSRDTLTKVGPSSIEATIGGNNSLMPRDEIHENQFVGNNEKMAKKSLTRTITGALVESQVVGREKEKIDLINLISKQDDQQPIVISVWGMGGLGKTTVVRSVYQSQRLGGWKCAWVTALRPFNCEAILRNLILQLQKDIQQDPAAASAKKQEKEAITAMRREELIAKLAHLVTQECLIVVDDLSSTEEWDSIKESLVKAGRVIVTTRE